MFEEVEFSYSEMQSILNGEPLTDKYKIENVVLAIQEMNKKVDFLKQLKKKRVESIDIKISSEEENIKKLQNAIKDCMIHNKEKTLDFPGVGKVQVKKSRGTWTIVDEEKLKEELISINKFEEVSEETWKFKKKDLNSLLDVLKTNNNLPSSVKEEEKKDSLSISFANKEEEQEKVTSSSKEVVAKNDESSFDKLEI